MLHQRVTTRSDVDHHDVLRMGGMLHQRVTTRTDVDHHAVRLIHQQVTCSAHVAHVDHPDVLRMGGEMSE